MLLVKKIKSDSTNKQIEDGNNSTRTTLKTIPKEIYKLRVSNYKIIGEISVKISRTIRNLE